MKEYFENNDCYLIETEYVNVKTPMRYIATCVHEHIISFNTFKNATGASKKSPKRPPPLQSPAPSAAFSESRLRRGIPLERLVSEKKLVFLLTGLQITCKILLSVYFKVMNLLKGKGMIYK